MRYGRDGSSVSVYVSLEGLVCSGCRSMSKTTEMVRHLEQHIARGDTVPDDVIPALLEDQQENDHPPREGRAMDLIRLYPRTTVHVLFVLCLTIFLTLMGW